MLSAAILAASLMQAPPAPAPAMAPAQDLAQGVTLIRGAIVPGRGPDGNTVVFDAREGLIVVDTGRHSWHSDAILAFARARQRAVAAIVNTHWHLDHSSGNGRIKAVYPDARVYTTNAVDRAMAPGGFIARSLESSRAMMEGDQLTDLQREELGVFFATMDHSDILRPDLVLDRSRRMRIAGKNFDVRVTDGAVTDADVWLYDRRSRIVVIGDLVTLPAPFFETACPDRWSAALDDVWATPFRIAVPGHGEPMTRDQFNLYRTAFNGFMACVRSDAEAASCASGWADGVSALTQGQNGRPNAERYAAYYVGYLRENAFKSPDCLSS